LGRAAACRLLTDGASGLLPDVLLDGLPCVYLRQGARIIKPNLGEPQPAAPVDPNLKSWSVHVIGGKKLAHLGDVHAVDEASAIKAASEKFTTLTISPDKAAGGQSDRALTTSATGSRATSQPSCRMQRLEAHKSSTMCLVMAQAVTPIRMKAARAVTTTITLSGGSTLLSISPAKW
jgi:hypothetical protein